MFWIKTHTVRQKKYTGWDYLGKERRDRTCTFKCREHLSEDLKIWESDIRFIYRITKSQLDSPTNSEDVEIWESIYRIKINKLRCRFTDKYFWDATQSRRSRVEVVCASVPSSQFEFLPYTSCSSVCGVSHSATNFTFISSKYAIKEGQMLKTNLSWYFKKHAVKKILIKMSKNEIFKLVNNYLLISHLRPLMLIQRSQNEFYRLR